MVEYVEEGILRAGLLLEVLNIVDDECVDALVEVEEVVGVAFGNGGGVLAFEEAGCDVENAAFGFGFLESYADCLNQMSLADACRAEHKEGVEGLDRGVVGN